VFNGNVLTKITLYCFGMNYLFSIKNKFIFGHSWHGAMTGDQGHLNIVKRGSHTMASIQGHNTVYGQMWFAGKPDAAGFYFT